MKKTFVIVLGLISFFTIASYGQQKDTMLRKQVLSPEQLQARQQRYERKADSAIANREIKRMKESFTLTPQQESALYQAGITISHERREIFKKYWKTEGFREQMIAVDKRADSVYQSIVGEANHKKYQAAMHSKLIERQQSIKERVRIDSINRKRQQP